jgi:RHS repeat-associated protein
LQATAPLTDFVYGGMFYNADSGLYLTLYRPYDPVARRWLSRDPLGEGTDPSGNLYVYVDGNPVAFTDDLGLGPKGAAIGAITGGTIGAILGGGVGIACGPGAPGCVPFTATEGGALGATFGAAVGNAIEDQRKAAPSQGAESPRLT